MKLTPIQESLLLATYFRGNTPRHDRWVSCCDQVVTLSLFYTGDITVEDCCLRFQNRGHVGALYDAEGTLLSMINDRYTELIQLIREQPDLIEGGGDFDTPAYPTFTACRLTDSGVDVAPEIARRFPTHPDFPEWPDSRTL